MNVFDRRVGVMGERPKGVLFCVLLLIGLVVFVLAGCGGDDTDTESATETTAEDAVTETTDGGEATSETAGSSSAGDLTALLPATYQEAGVLKVGSDIPFAPMEYYEEDGTTLTGIDVDLMEAIAANLGLEVEWVNTAWDGLIPALKSKRFDVIAASMGDFTDRQEQVTFVDYLYVGEAALVKAGNGASVETEEDLSGKAVGASKGTIAVTILDDLNEKLQAEGMDPVEINQFPGDQDGLLAVQSERVFAHVLDLPAAAYEAATVSGGSALELVLPNLMGGIPYGFAVRKEEGDLAEALSASLQQMIDDGSYVAILEKYGVEGGAIEEATINGGTTSAQ